MHDITSKIMNVEENRLRTFSDWPSDTVVSPVRIAKAGFFAINEEQTVQCFACGVRISEWEYGDQVMAKHRQLSPQCPFVIDPSTSGNDRELFRNLFVHLYEYVRIFKTKLVFKWVFILKMHRYNLH